MLKLLIGWVIGTAMGIVATVILCGRLDRWEERRAMKEAIKKAADAGTSTAELQRGAERK